MRLCLCHGLLLVGLPTVLLMASAELKSDPQKRLLVKRLEVTGQRTVEFYMEKIRVEYKYPPDYPEPETFRQIWYRLTADLVDEKGRKKVWSENYIEFPEDNNFREPSEPPFDFQACTKDLDTVGLAFVVPGLSFEEAKVRAYTAIFYEIDLRKQAVDVLPLKAAPLYSIHHRPREHYCTGIWDHDIPLERELSKCVGQLMAHLFPYQVRLRLLSLSWKEPFWLLEGELGVYRFLLQGEYNETTRKYEWSLRSLAVRSNKGKR